MKKTKWWIVLLAVLLVAVILAVIFGDTILILAAPKAMLTKALTSTISQLDERFRMNPIRNTLDVYDPQGKYTAVMELDTANDLLGEISYDMTLQTDLTAHQAYAEGVVGFSDRDLSLSLYLNGDFVALSSPKLVNGNYYGITYETFSEDLGSFPLVKRLIPSATMQKWEDSLGNIQEVMNRSYEMPELSEADYKNLLMGILALKCRVEKAEYPLNGQQVPCYALTYGADGEQVKELLGHILDTESAQTAEVSACFYLYQNQLIALSVDGSAGENHVRYILTLGEDPSTNDLTLKTSRTENGATNDMYLEVSTQQSGNHYAETLTITKNQAESNRISYDWDTVTGDMTLNWNDVSIELNMTNTDAGLRIVTDDFGKLTDILLQKEEGTAKTISCTMTLNKGSAIAEPAYKNLDQWSMEDLWILLSSIGELIGLKIG